MARDNLAVRFLDRLLLDRIVVGSFKKPDSASCFVGRDV